MSKIKINLFSGGLEFSPGSTHYLLSIRNSASNATECERNLKLVLMVGASVDEEETPRSLTAAAMVSVNKPRRQLQRRLVEEEVVGQRSKDTLLYQRDQLSLSMSIWHSWVIAHWFEARFNGILGDMRTNLRMKYVISVLFFYL